MPTQVVLPELVPGSGKRVCFCTGIVESESLRDLRSLCHWIQSQHHHMA